MTATWGAGKSVLARVLETLEIDLFDAIIHTVFGGQKALPVTPKAPHQI